LEVSLTLGAGTPHPSLDQLPGSVKPPEECGGEKWRSDQPDQQPPAAATFVVESTYGDRDHPDADGQSDSSVVRGMPNHSSKP